MRLGAPRQAALLSCLQGTGSLMKWLSGCGLLFVGALAALTLLSRSCQRVTRLADAPDGTAQVAVIEDPGIGDSLVYIDLREYRFYSKRLTRGADCWLDFAHAAWSPDSRYVSIVANGIICEIPPVTFDRLDRRFVTFRQEEVRESIRRRYDLRPRDLAAFQNDPLQWALANDNPRRREAFRKLYPPEP